MGTIILRDVALGPGARPTVSPRFALAHPAHFLALGLGSGLAPVAPGTFGTLLGWLLYDLAAPYLSPIGWAAVLAVGLVAGIWACGKTGRALGVPDHGAMVWDEIIAIWAVLLFTPQGFWWQLTAFGLFRFFDIVKPPPIRTIDGRWKGGLGVMADDLVAAFFALVALAVGKRLLDAVFSG